VNGDRLQLDLSVGAGAACLLSTQGETRVYRSPRGCSNQLRAKVEDGGLLAVIPDPTVCFAGADYFQRTEITVEPRAAVVFADVLAAGRSARGERWAFSRYAAELKLQLGHCRIVDETLLLDPAQGPLAQRFGRFDAFATLLLVGEALREVRVDLGQKLGALPLPARASQLQSASALGDHALLIRMAAVSVEDVLQTIRAHLSFLPALLGDDPWSRRN
jgi:urease accessory protein